MSEAEVERRNGLRRAEDVAVRLPARSRGWLISVGIAIGFCFFLALQIVSCQRTSDIDRVDIFVCREANIPNAYMQLVLKRVRFDHARYGLPAPEEALPILSCQETAERDRPIRLRPREERRYLDVFRLGRLPVVTDGRVTGSEPFPPPATP